MDKAGFFSGSAMKFFQISKSQKKIFQKTILSLKFKFPANNSKVFLAGNLNFKFRIVFWNIFLGGLEIWKTNHTFWKKPPLHKTKFKKEIFQKTILSLKFEFQVHDSLLEYIFLEIWRFEKHIALSEKNPPLVIIASYKLQ